MFYKAWKRTNNIKIKIYSNEEGGKKSRSINGHPKSSMRNLGGPKFVQNENKSELGKRSLCLNGKIDSP